MTENKDNKTVNNGANFPGPETPGSEALGLPSPKPGRPPGEFCLYLTHKGKRCTKAPLPGEDYCYIHIHKHRPDYSRTEAKAKGAKGEALEVEVLVPAPPPDPDHAKYFHAEGFSLLSFRVAGTEEEQALYLQQWRMLHENFELNESSDRLCAELICSYQVKSFQCLLSGQITNAEILDRMISRQLNNLKASRISREGTETNHNHSLLSPAEHAAKLMKKVREMGISSGHKSTLKTTRELPAGPSHIVNHAQGGKVTVE